MIKATIAAMTYAAAIETAIKKRRELGLSSYPDVETARDSNRVLDNAAKEANTLQELIDTRLKMITDANDAYEKSLGSTGDATDGLSESNKAYVKILQKEIDALKAKRDANKKANDEMQRQIDLQLKQQDLANKMKQEQIKGNYLEAALLGQEQRKNTIEFNQGTADNKLADVLDRLEKRLKEVEDGANLTKAEDKKVKEFKKEKGKKAAAGGYISNYMGGGNVSGPGTKTSDSIPAMLSDGEYVIKADSVSKYGVGTFDALNAQRFAKGGMVPGYKNGTPGGVKDFVYTSSFAKSPFSGSWITKDQAKLERDQANSFIAAVLKEMTGVPSFGRLVTGKSERLGDSVLPGWLAKTLGISLDAVGSLPLLGSIFKTPKYARLVSGAIKSGSRGIKTSNTATQTSPAAMKDIFKKGPWESSLSSKLDMQKVIDAVVNTQGMNSSTVRGLGVVKSKDKGLQYGGGFYDVRNEAFTVGKTTNPTTVAHEAFHHVDMTSSFESFDKLTKIMYANNQGREASELISKVYPQWLAKDKNLYPLVETILKEQNKGMYPVFRGIMEGSADGNVLRIPQATRDKLNIRSPFADNKIYNLYTLKDMMDASMNLGDGYSYMRDPGFIKGYLSSAAESAGSVFPSSLRGYEEKWISVLNKFGINQDTPTSSQKFLDFYDYIGQNNLAMGGMVKKFKIGGLAKLPKFHDWNGPVPGSYGQELPAVLKSGTEGIYQEGYINDLKQAASNTTNSSSSVYNVSMNINGADSDPKQIAEEVMKKMQVLTNKNNKMNVGLR
jgi:hypothetical protein